VNPCQTFLPPTQQSGNPGIQNIQLSLYLSPPSPSNYTLVYLPIQRKIFQIFVVHHRQRLSSFAISHSLGPTLPKLTTLDVRRSALDHTTSKTRIWTQKRILHLPERLTTLLPVMSGWGIGGWFGGGAAARKEAPKKAILALRAQLEMLSKREKHLENQINEQDGIARKHISTNKNGKLRFSP
jgi:cell division protein FtsB